MNALSFPALASIWPKRYSQVHALSLLCPSISNVWDSIKRTLTANNPVPVFKYKQLADDARDCVLIIDASPSMLEQDWKPSRLRAAQEAAEAYIRRLAVDETNARVAIVAYACYATRMCGLINVSKGGELTRHITRITSGTGTNITAGLRCALKILRDTRRINQVILLSDGCHNFGPNPQKVAAELKKIATIECVGIGGSTLDVDEDLMKAIASPYPDGSKRYRWIGDKERLVQHYHNLAGRIVKAP